MELAAEVGLRPKALLVPSGIDMANFESLPANGTFRRDYPEFTNKQLIVFLGRLAPQKGLDLLVKAFSIVASRHPNARLILAGPDEGNHSRRVTSWLSDLGLVDRTTFLGMISDSTKLALLVDTDVWVLPSYAENFGTAAVEAMACGLPIVITDRVGIASDVDEAKAGFVVRCDAGEIGEALCTVLESSQSRELGRAGKRLVQQRFTWEVAATRMIEAYEHIRRH
jgi:glycosyltransferase involved in cell wall biosynthesis